MANEEDKTLWCGNLHENVTEELLYELFLQVIESGVQEIVAVSHCQWGASQPVRRPARPLTS